MTAPDGRVYAYQAGWNDVHITDVTDPYNTTVVGHYVDPNTQVLDVKYLEHNGNEFLILQNQLIDSGMPIRMSASGATRSSECYTIGCDRQDRPLLRRLMVRCRPPQWPTQSVYTDNRWRMVHFGRQPGL